MNILNYFFVMIFTVSASAQQDSIPVYPKSDFGSPLEIPFRLAGNFGEPRYAHFHTGIDIRTNEVEGLNVHALADGYVSRIGISPYGYGNVLYITYPNGFTSVFGHLQRFNDTITAVARREQYAKEEFSIDISLKPYELPVHKGEIVAYSGNTGGSGGPHLHFEIRDALERPINPMNFGYQVADKVPPSIGGVKLYPMDELKYTASGCRPPVSGSGSSYTLKNGLQKVNSRFIGIAINTFDRTDELLHSVDIYNLRLYEDDSLKYEYRVDRLSFDYTRYVIAQIDYPIFLKEGSRSFQKCFLECNNSMPSAYCNLKNNGIINLSDGAVHAVRIIATDYAGNKSTLTMDLQYDSAALAFKPKPHDYMKVLSPFQDNVISGEDFRITIPGKMLLDSLFVNYSSTPNTTQGIFSNIIKIDESLNHLLGYITVAIKPVNLPENLKDKALIAWRDHSGGIAARGGKWDGDMLTAQCRELGSFFIMIDTTPPRIVPVNITKGKNMHTAGYISMRIADGLSGIADYHGYIDDRWELMSMDGKTGTLKMILPKGLPFGEHTFRLTVVDDRKNMAEYSVAFSYSNVPQAPVTAQKSTQKSKTINHK